MASKYVCSFETETYSRTLHFISGLKEGFTDKSSIFHAHRAVDSTFFEFQVYKVNNMRCNYYNSYYIHALIKQRNKTNGSTQSCIFDPSSKHQTLDVPFTRRHMHTSDTDTHAHMHNRTATYMNNQNQNSSKHINCLCRRKHYNIYNNTHVTICQFMP